MFNRKEVVKIKGLHPWYFAEIDNGLEWKQWNKGKYESWKSLKKRVRKYMNEEYGKGNWRFED